MGMGIKFKMGMGLRMKSLKWEGISTKNLYPHTSTVKLAPAVGHNDGCYESVARLRNRET